MTTQLSEIASVIRANNAEFERNMQLQDASRLVQAFYAEDAVVLPPDSPAVSGRSRIVEYWGQGFKNGLREVKLNNTQVQTSGDLACDIGNFALKMQAEGGQTSEALGKYLVVLQKQNDGSWKAIADIFNFGV